VAIDVDAFASVGWRKVLRDKDRPGMLARRHLEVCVFSHVAVELRSGDIAVAGSDSYADLGAQLMSWEECAPLAAQFCEQAGIPAEAGELVVFYRRQLVTTAAVVDAGYPANTDLVLEGGRPVLKRRKGADRRPLALALEQAVHQRLPERSLLDILTRAAYLTGWPRHLGPASGLIRRSVVTRWGAMYSPPTPTARTSARPRLPDTCAGRSPPMSSTPRATSTPPPTRSTSVPPT
jgi:hypothetical protein